MGPWNFPQYMHPFDGSLEFKAVSSDAMKPQLLRNFCEFPSTQDGSHNYMSTSCIYYAKVKSSHQHMIQFPSLHHYMSTSCVYYAKVKFPSTYDGISITASLHVYDMDNWMLNKDSAKGTECVCSGAAEQPPDYCKTPGTAPMQTGAL